MNIWYFSFGILFSALTIFLPILGLVFFDKNDKNNLHVFSKMYGDKENI